MKRIIPFLLCLATLFGCQKNIIDDSPTIPGTPIPAASPVNGSVKGRIINENNDPVANVPVKINTTTVMTDDDGYFSTSTITLDKYFTAATVEVPGYYKALRNFSATASRNYLLIKLIKKQLAGTFASGSNGLITLTDGTSLTFSANSIIDKNTGAAYTGNVRVFATFIDPTSDDIAATLPGSLIGISNNEVFALRSTGMLAVELESDGGVPLQLATGKPAAIKMPVPVSLLGVAPSTIDTWSLDDRGIWKKEGMATRSGNMYVYEASHFSFWNLDVPIQAVYLHVHVQNTDLNPLRFHQVSLTSSTTFGTSYGYTDSSGNVSGIVPKNESLLLKVRTQTFPCNQAIYSQQVGPYSVDAMETITAVFASNQQYTFSGSAVDCNNQPIDSGLVKLYFGGYLADIPVVNGNFSTTISGCSGYSQVSYFAINYSTNQQSPYVSQSFLGNAVNLGTITVCSAPPPPPPPSDSSYISYYIDGGVNSTITGASARALFVEVTATRTRIYADGFNYNVDFWVDGAGVGTYGVTDSVTFNFQSGAPLSPNQVVFTSFGTFVTGTFSITYRTFVNGAVVMHQASGSFNIRR